MNDYWELLVDLRWDADHPWLSGDKQSEDIVRAITAIESLVKERDAAVADLAQQRVCKVCKYLDTRIDDDPCYSCMVSLAKMPVIGFEWRGLQEVTT